MKISGGALAFQLFDGLDLSPRAEKQTNKQRKKGGKRKLEQENQSRLQRKQLHWGENINV